MRIAILLAVALPLTAVDLGLKVVRPTPDWAWHERSVGWMVLCLVVLACVLGLLYVPSSLVPPAAGVLAGGVLGNALSAAWNDLEVPNPIIVTEGRAVIAFNLADVWVMTGLLALFSVLAVWLVRNRDALPAWHHPRR
jgi:lipoprotein signal peptidase